MYPYRIAEIVNAIVPHMFNKFFLTYGATSVYHKIFKYACFLAGQRQRFTSDNSLARFCVKRNINDIKSSDFFKSNNVTVVNYWFSTCKPCVGELPELEALNKKLAEKGGQVVGINTFTIDGDRTAISEAKDILSKKGVTYKNIWFDSNSDAGKFTSGLFSYPTTYVVDKNGNIVGEPIVGAITEKNQAKTLEKLIDQALQVK